jgi:hypothetical protein
MPPAAVEKIEQCVLEPGHIGLETRVGDRTVRA